MSGRALRSSAVSATLAGFILVATQTALAQQPDTSSWECRFCPFQTGSHTDYAVGITNMDDDAARFGDATGYDDAGTYLNLDGTGTHIADDYRWDWDAEDLGLDSRVLNLTGGRPGSFGYRIGYRQLPRYAYDTTRSVYTASGGNLVLPSNWASAVADLGFAAAVNANLAAVDIASEREILSLGGDYLLNSQFQFFADYAREKRDGVDMLGGSFFTQSAVLPRPFDYQTDQWELGARYRADWGSLQLAYYGSFFESSTIGVAWDNPFGLPTDPARPDQGQLAQPPDNDAHQITLSGLYRLTSRTLVSFAAGVGSMAQDRALLPYTINANLAPEPLPRANLDGDVDTSHWSLTLTSRPIPKGRVKFAYRFDDRDNGTSVDTWNRIIADAFVSGDSEVNAPYSFQRSRLSLSADYDLFNTLRLSGGYERKELERDLQEVAEQTEDIGWGRLRWRPNAWLDVNAKAGTARRDIDQYDTSLAASLGQNPLLRKYNLAYRYREFIELTASAALPDRNITVSASARYADDSYTRSVLGLLNSDATRYGFDVAWQASAETSLYLHSSWEDMDADQAGSEFAGPPDWRASTADAFQTYGLGVRTSALSDKIDLTLDYTHADGSSETTVLSAGGSNSRFPDIESDLNSLRLMASYRWSERLHARLELRYEDFKMEDWALAGVGPLTIPTVLSLGAQPYDYDVLLIGLSLRYGFGGGDIALPVAAN